MSSTNPGDKSPAAIEEDVERSRASVSGTLDALRGKLAPGQIVEELVDRVSEFARGSGGASFARNLGGAVRDNPLPVLLIGAGLGWLMLGQGASGQSGASQRAAPRVYPYGQEHPVAASDAAGETGGSLGDVATRLGSYVGDAASRVAEAGSSLISGAKEGGESVTEGAAAVGQGAAAATREAWSSASDLLETQPLLAGLLGVAVGAALGAALPRTQAENQWLGEAAEAVTARIGALGRETAGQLRAATSEHVQGATDAAAEGYAKVKERLDEGSLSGAVAAAGEALGTVAQAAANAASSVAGEAGARMDAATGQAEPETKHPPAV